MKRIFKIISSALIICLIPISMVAGQDRKNEQKIKIIIDDGSGKRVVIDTLLKGSQITDTLKLKDGSAIFVGRPEHDSDLMQNADNKQVFVTVSDDGKVTKKVVKKVSVLTSDSINNNEDVEHNKIYVYNDSKTSDCNSVEKHKVTHWSDIDENGPEEKVIIIRDRKVVGNDYDKSIEHAGSADDKLTNGENTKYVISKDGMVITIEGNDYNKVKELVKDIENKLNARKDADLNSKPAKEEQKKTLKK
jgi:hypothetical protein